MSARTKTPTRRTAAKVIYFRPNELARITARARAAGQAPSQFIRESALGKSTGPDPLLSELTVIGQRLDQIARLPQQADGALVVEVRAALNRHWAIVREILADRRRGRGVSAR